VPGSRDRNLRSGALCEGLGLELLRPFAFVAPVPRTEDVGVDAVATLSRRVGRRLIAEESFLVQVKSASVRSLLFEGEELDWLRALRLPYFLQSVELATSTVELWSLALATTHPNFRDRKSLTVHLDKSKFDISSDGMHVWLGRPILRWKPSDAVSEKFQARAYRVLKRWMDIEADAIAMRALGMTRPVRWRTNQRPKLTGAHAIMHHPSQLRAVLNRVCPYIQTLSSLVTPSNEEGDDLLAGLLLVSEFMRRNGVDPDPNGIMKAFARLRMRSRPPEISHDGRCLALTMAGERCKKRASSSSSVCSVHLEQS